MILTLVMLKGINGYFCATALEKLVSEDEISGHASAYPALRSLRRSTKMSKSIELGESKSYSFLCARMCCSGFKTL